jgi:CelD/BcsL family acetyltransferase involved in cellulose biosynthesis
MADAQITVRREMDDVFLGEWKALWLASPQGHFYNSPSWFLTCVDAFQSDAYWIFAGYRGKELAAVCPMVRSAKFGVPALTFAGGNYADRGALLYGERDEALLKDLLQEIQRHDSCLWSEIDEATADTMKTSNGNSISRVSSSCRYLPFEADPLRFFSRAHRNNMSNRLHKAKVKLELRQCIADAASCLQPAYDIEAGSYKRSKAKDVFGQAMSRRFYERLIHYHPGQVLIHLLTDRDKPVAYEIDFLCKDVCYGCQKAYLEEYRYCMPGKLLSQLLLTRLFEQGVTRFEWGRGDDTFKREFCPFVRRQYNFFVTAYAPYRWWYGRISGVQDYLEKHPRVYEFVRINKNRVMGR